MSESQDIDALLHAELERLRRERPSEAAALLNQALGRSPSGRSAASEKIGPALPSRTQHHSPIESESRFVRYAGWWEETSCLKCGHSSRRFDGLYEERDWIAAHAGGPKHWLACLVAPLPELTKDAVTYVRYYTQNFCEKCVGAENWPLAQTFKDGEIVS